MENISMHSKGRCQEKAIFGLSAAGVLFAGYLTFSKLITGVCAFGESCPTFLGYPSCWYGLGMFTLLAFFSGVVLFASSRRVCALRAIAGVSLLGVLFAGYFTMQEIGILMNEGFRAFALGLPTCAYGLVVFLAIALLALPLALRSVGVDSRKP